MKAPLTFAERARKLGEADRLQYQKARELLEELEELKEPAETYVDKDTTDLLESLAEGIEQLTTLISLGMNLVGTDFDDAAGWVNSLTEQLPSEDLMRAFLDAWERLEGALDEMQEQRDDPSSSDRDEKASARDEARSALEAVADALDDLDTPGNS